MTARLGQGASHVQTVRMVSQQSETHAKLREQRTENREQKVESRNREQYGVLNHLFSVLCSLWKNTPLDYFELFGCFFKMPSCTRLAPGSDSPGDRERTGRSSSRSSFGLS